ncbi:hypothetical protein [Anatilimnocola floriformis]|uniref:hypothetical protein n=1 Tax=Anatilimnocola floriformis TaxID=2948575 RepID=UPI0020C4B326|nr:hypothetical protein [Anatilimnocola floriformis]
MTNPYESPVPEDEIQPSLDADPIARGEQIGPEYRVLFFVALAIVIYNDGFFIGALYQMLTPTNAAQLLMVIASAAGLAALPLAVWRKWQRSATFPVQLGHWILLMAGAAWLGLKVSEAWYVQLGSNSLTEELGSGNTLRQMNVVRAVVLLVISSIYWLALNSLRGDRLSQAYVLAAIAGLYVVGLTPLLGISRIMAGLVAIPAALAVMILFGTILVRDLLHPKTKDPMHWVGFSTIALNAAAALINAAQSFWILYSDRRFDG